MFLKGAKHYPSTETIGLIIMEEFILVAVILFAAISFQVKEIAVGIFITYTLHLFGHIFQCLKLRKSTPGSRTALATLLPIFFVLYLTFKNTHLNITNTIIWTVVLLLALLLNLKLLHWTAGKIENWRKNNM